MGLLGNILSGAVSDAIGKAVGEATKKVVTPVAERVAEKQAEVVDHLAKKAESAVDEAAAQAEAGGQAQAAPLTEEQKEQQKQALDALKGFSTMFSGAVAMAKKEAEAEEALRQAKEQAVFDNWEANLGQYPVWDVGGERFEIEEQTPMNGYPVWRLSLRGRPYLVELYAAKLRNAIGQTIDADFAPALYLMMDNDEKLKSPSYVKYPCGFAMCNSSERTMGHATECDLGAYECFVRNGNTSQRAFTDVMPTSSTGKRVAYQKNDKEAIERYVTILDALGVRL